MHLNPNTSYKNTNSAKLETSNQPLLQSSTLNSDKTLQLANKELSLSPSVSPSECLIASRWELCSEDEILFVFSENVSLVLYPQSFYFSKIYPWTSWMRHIYGYTLSVFKAILRIFADVSVWPWCLIASRWELRSEGEILFVFSENVSLVL